MFFPFGTQEIFSMEGRKLWFRATYLGLGAVLRDGTQLEGPFFAVDDKIVMLYAGAGSAPDSCFVEFIEIVEPGRPVIIDTAEVILKPLDPRQMSLRELSAIADGIEEWDEGRAV